MREARKRRRYVPANKQVECAKKPERNKDRIELAKMNLMIDEGKEFSLKDSLSKIGKGIVIQTLQKHSDSQIKAAQALGLTDGAIRQIIK